MLLQLKADMDQVRNGVIKEYLYLQSFISNKFEWVSVPKFLINSTDKLEILFEILIRPPIVETEIISF